MEFGWSPADASFREEVRAFLREHLPADWDTISQDGPGSDAQVAFSRRFCPLLAERGWLTPHWPREIGGGGESVWRYAILAEEMWAAGEPRGPQYMNVNWIGPTIAAFGSDAQKREHLPRISRGDILYCQGFSEPNAGSDLASIATRADRRGDTYVVRGQKIWTSYCKGASHCILLVRTDTTPAGARHRGLSVLLVPMALSGIVVREIDTLLGAHYFHEVFFEDVEVPVACRLGGENQGWEVAMYALQYERVGLPRYARSERVLAELERDARRREASNAKFDEARALCAAARLLYYRVVDQRARGAPPTADANVARVALTRADQAVGELALDVWGDAALVYGSPGDAHFRAALPAGIATGTTEIQLGLVAERMLGLPRQGRA
jgi:alkylation response protein AidB-like acyl-CoA dehydrogenase